MKNDTSNREARARMDAAKAQSERTFSTEQRLPRRYKLYDKIKDHVSLRTVDTVIIVVAALIIILLVVGIMTGKPSQ